MGLENDNQTQPHAQMCHRQGKCSATLKHKSKAERPQGQRGRKAEQGPAVPSVMVRQHVGGCGVFRAVGTKEEWTCPLLQIFLSPTEKLRQKPWAP